VNNFLKEFFEPFVILILLFQEVDVFIVFVSVRNGFNQKEHETHKDCTKNQEDVNKHLVAFETLI
jgi:hypothetical protein